MKQQIKLITAVIFITICGYMRNGYAVLEPIEPWPFYMKLINALARCAVIPADLETLGLNLEERKKSANEIKKKATTRSDSGFENGFYHIGDYKLYWDNECSNAYVLNDHNDYIASYSKGDGDGEDINEEVGIATLNKESICTIDTSVHVVVLNQDGKIERRKIDREKLSGFSSALIKARRLGKDGKVKKIQNIIYLPLVLNRNGLDFYL